MENAYSETVVDKSEDVPRHVKGILVVVPAALGIVSIGFLFYLSVSTKFGNVRGTIKNSEKFLLYNVILPDIVLSASLLIFVVPATYTLEWKYDSSTTTWVGFVFLWSLFHGSLAMANICNLIALSYTTGQRYDAINVSQKMFLISLSYAAVTCCLCSFPATERNGFQYSPYWFQPTITIYEGYGGIFSLASNTGLVLLIIGSSLRDLVKIRQGYKDDKKVSKKVQEDLDRHINFAGLCLTMAFFIPMPMLIAFENHVIVFIFRLLLYVCPICRVMLLTRTCPHFHFQASTDLDQALLSEFAQLANFQ